MRPAKLVLVVLLVLLTVSACGRVKISPAALDDFRNTTRLSVPDAIELSDDDISRLAVQGNVDEAVIRDVAPTLDSQSTWKSSLTKLREIVDDVPEEVRAGTIDVACDAIKGELTTIEDFAQALYEQFPTDETDVEQIVTSFYDYYVDMSAALEAGDERAAAVTLTCYIASESS
jgi:hypothetical protein